MSQPGLAIATQIATALGMTLGVDVFNGGIRPEPVRAVWCLTYGGRTPEDIIDNRNISRKYPRVQIRVRDVQQSFGAGEAFARSVYDAVHLIVPSGYLDCRAIESAPLYLGADDFGRHEWSINIELTIKE